MLIEKINPDDELYLDYFVLQEHRLWFSCMLHAIREAVYGCPADFNWLFADKMQVGSFLWICEYLDLCPLYWRKQYLKNAERLRLHGRRIIVKDRDEAA